MQGHGVDVVGLNSSHMAGVVALTQAVGWPHQVEDWTVMTTLGQGVVAIENERRLVGAGWMTFYGSSSAAVGMVMVDPTRQGRGLGRSLMGALLRQAGQRTVSLVSTADGRRLYESLGFRHTGTVIQHQGTAVRGGTSIRLDGISFEDDVDKTDLIAVDGVAYGVSRSSLIPTLHELGQTAVLRRNNAIAGFAMVRRFAQGWVVGPVVAAHAADARALITFCVTAHQGDLVRIDSDGDCGVTPWVSGLGLKPVSTGYAMSRGRSLVGSPTPMQTYALASQAMG